MSQFPGGHVNSGLVAAQSLGQSLNPHNIARTMEAFGRVQEQETQRQVFTNLLQQHQSDLKSDPDYRKYFSQVAKNNPNALMDARNLSEARGSVGAIRENMGMLKELEKRIDTFANSPQGQAIGFNAEFKREELKRIATVIQRDPELGSQILMQEMGILSGAMQHAQTEQTITQFLQSTKDQTTPQRLAALDNTKGISQDVRAKIQKFLLDRNTHEALAASKLPGADETSGFKNAIAAASKVVDEPGLVEFKQSTSAMVERGGMTAKEKVKADEEAEENFKQAREFESEVQKQQDFSNNVNALVTDMVDKGFEPNEQGLTQYLADDEENVKRFKGATNFDSVGEARRGIQNFDQIIQQRFQESLEIESTNEQVLRQFEELGGESKSNGKAIAIPSTKIKGALTIPTEKSNVAVYKNVPPDDKLTPGGFFKFAFDERGLPGVTGMNLVPVQMPDGEGGTVATMLPSFEAIETRQTASGDQIVFHMPDVGSEPRVLVVPVNGNQLDYSQAKPLNLKEYARDIAKNVDPDEEADRIALLLKSVDSFIDGVETEASKVTGQKKKQLLDVMSNAIKLSNTMTVMRRISVFEIFSDNAGRDVKQLQRGTSEEAELVTTALMRYYIEYARFNAAMTNTFTDTDDGSAEP